MPNPRGTLVVSLDFELYWGMIDKVTLKEYGPNVLGVRRALPAMLDLFDKYGVKATWATLGLISFRDKKDLFASLPERTPAYTNSKLSPYEYLKTAPLGEDEVSDPYHYAASLIEEIQKHPDQEIGSHTFSHYYCLEEGQTEDDFRADLAASVQALTAFGITPRSLVLPRNQSREDYLPAMQKAGFRTYRGNPRHFLYAPREEGKQVNLFIRALRLLDHYLPLSGHHTYDRSDFGTKEPYNIPASIFLRPYTPTLALFESLKLARIKSSMTKAAKEGKLFHIWWHPHNFGIHTERNLQNLENILQHFAKLQEKYGMESRTMIESAPTHD